MRVTILVLFFIATVLAQDNGYGTPQQRQPAPSNGYDAPQQRQPAPRPQAPSNGYDAPQQRQPASRPQAPVDGYETPQQRQPASRPQAPVDGYETPQRPQAPVVTRQRPQAPADSYVTPQRPQAPVDDGPNFFERLGSSVSSAWNQLSEKAQARLSKVRVRFSNGKREFFDKSKNQWVEFSDDMKQFASASKARFEAGQEYMFDAATKTWITVKTAADEAGDWLVEKYGKLMQKLSETRCRIHEGRQEFKDAVTGKWVQFTVEMRTFSIEVRASFKENKEYMFDKATRTFIAIGDGIEAAGAAISAKWKAVMDQLAAVRCRVRQGKKQFYDKARSEWRDFTADMSAFYVETRSNLVEGQEYVFDKVKGAFVAVGDGLEAVSDFVIAKFQAVVKTLSATRCRVKRGLYQFFDSARNEWRDFSNEMQAFIAETRSNLKEGQEYVFEQTKKAFVAVGDGIQAAGVVISAKWKAVVDQLSAVRCRVRRGRQEFFDKARNEWREFTVDMKDFYVETRSNLKEGQEYVFDKSKAAFIAVGDGVEAGLDFISTKWKAVIAKLKSARCRVRSGVTEFYNQVDRRWEAFTADMIQFSIDVRANLKEGQEYIFDQAKNAFVAVGEGLEATGNAIAAKWNAVIAQLSAVRCRVRRGKKQFYDKARSEWRDFTVDMHAFSLEVQANLQEGQEYVFDKAKSAFVAVANSIDAAGVAISEKWKATIAKLAAVRCRVRRGRQEFFDKARNEWKEFSADMIQFTVDVQANFKEGQEYVFDTVKNAFVAVADGLEAAGVALAAKWKATIAKFSAVRCRVRRGRQEFFDKAKMQWVEFSADMTQFSIEVRADLKEGQEYVFDTVKNAFVAVADGLEATGDAIAAKWKAIIAQLTVARCRVRRGKKQFFDKARSEWREFTANMEAFYVEVGANLKEGQEYIFDTTKNAFVVIAESIDASVNFVAAKWTAVIAKLNAVRCRVRRGVKEYYDNARNEWREFTVEMRAFSLEIQADFKEGQEYVFEKTKNAFVAVAVGFEAAGAAIAEKWKATIAKFAAVRCRVRRGRQEFFDKARNEWREFSADMTQFSIEVRADLKEGQEYVFDAAKNAFVAVADSIDATSARISAKWSAIIAKLKSVRCRVRRGVQEYRDEVTGRWVQFTADMVQFSVEIRANLKEGQEYVFDQAKGAFEVVVDSVNAAGAAISAKWKAVIAQLAAVRCRVRQGKKEFFDKARSEWREFTADMSAFYVEIRADLKEGQEYVFEQTKNAFVVIGAAIESAGDAISARWTQFKERLSRTRCRVRGGITEFYSLSEQRWKRATGAMTIFIRQFKADMIEGAEYTFNRGMNAFEVAKTWVNNKWASLRAKIALTKCRTRAGVTEVFDLASRKWTAADQELTAFIAETKINFKQGIDYTWSSAKNTWIVVSTGSRQAAEKLALKWNAMKGKMTQLNCRVRGGVNQFFDGANQRWVAMTTKMNEFVNLCEASFIEGVVWTFDQVSNTWKAVSSAVDRSLLLVDAKLEEWKKAQQEEKVKETALVSEYGRMEKQEAAEANAYAEVPAVVPRVQERAPDMYQM